MLEEPELHGERHEPLLGPVMDVALELLRPLVLRRDDPPSGRAEVIDQADVLKRQTRPVMRSPRINRSFEASIGSLGGMLSVIAPSNSPVRHREGRDRGSVGGERVIDQLACRRRRRVGGPSRHVDE